MKGSPNCRIDIQGCPSPLIGKGKKGSIATGGNTHHYRKKKSAQIWGEKREQNNWTMLGNRKAGGKRS